MKDIPEELLQIIEDVRTHVQYRLALGVRAIGSAGANTAAAGPPVPGERIADAASSREGTGEPVAPAPPGSLEDIRQEIGDCRRCKLHGGRRTIVFGEGSAEADVVFVGEGPGFEEDQQGRPFVGAAGQLLTDIIVKGMRLRREDVYICNIVKCRPPGNRNPEPDEVEACIGFVKKQIAAINPQVIVTLGNVPTQNLLRTREGITRMRGKWQEYEGVPVMPTFHPSYLLRSPGAKKEVWEDIKQVMVKLGLSLPEKKP